MVYKWEKIAYFVSIGLESWMKILKIVFLLKINYLVYFFLKPVHWDLASRGLTDFGLKSGLLGGPVRSPVPIFSTMVGTQGVVC